MARRHSLLDSSRRGAWLVALSEEVMSRNDIRASRALQ